MYISYKNGLKVLWMSCEETVRKTALEKLYIVPSLT